MHLPFYKVKCVVITQVDTILKTEGKNQQQQVLLMFASWCTFIQLALSNNSHAIQSKGWSSSCCDSVEEHWLLMPEVSWVWLPAAAGLFTFHLITSKFTYFQHEARCSEHDYPCITTENTLTMHNITCFQYVKHLFHKIGTHCFLSWCYVYYYYDSI